MKHTIRITSIIFLAVLAGLSCATCNIGSVEEEKVIPFPGEFLGEWEQDNYPFTSLRFNNLDGVGLISFPAMFTDDGTVEILHTVNQRDDTYIMNDNYRRTYTFTLLLGTDGKLTVSSNFAISSEFPKGFFSGVYSLPKAVDSR